MLGVLWFWGFSFGFGFVVVVSEFVSVFVLVFWVLEFGIWFLIYGLQSLDFWFWKFDCLVAYGCFIFLGGWNFIKG